MESYLENTLEESIHVEARQRCSKAIKTEKGTARNTGIYFQILQCIHFGSYQMYYNFMLTNKDHPTYDNNLKEGTEE